MPSVAWLSVAPVKGLALSARDEVRLELFGVAENRRFHLVGDDGRLVNGKTAGELVTVQARWDEGTGRLTLELPDGAVVEDVVELGEPIETGFYGRPVAGRVVQGPWAQALSTVAGRSMRLVQPDAPGGAVDRGAGAGVSLLSRASLAELARHAGEAEVDERRFRMLIGLDGCHAHEEDEWVGRDVRIGDAVIRPLGNVGRCAVTTQNPETGVPDVDTLRALGAYRPADTTEPLAFGVWGAVVTPGPVRLGDPVALV